ncbi:MAG: choice-of-anchor A family protein [Phycisphaerales bacterium]|jgi:choice-of-anchor A domain-containing protein|nr:choice-of-anchor A family protein [Phycisphaerales bacterium]
MHTIGYILIAAACSPAAASPLGQAEGFTVFVLENYQANNTDCTGRVAVGGDAQFNNVGIGSGLPNSSGARDDLIVGDDLLWTNGQNFNGNTQVSNDVSLTSVGTPNGSVGASVTVNFSDAKSDLEALSDDLAAIEADGTVVRQWGQLFLSGQESDVNVFDLDTGDFYPCYGLHIDVPAGSSVLVNVSGSIVSLNWFQPFLTGVEPDHLFFNFAECTVFQMNGIGWKGSILAPRATMQFNNGQIDGGLVLKDLQGNGESHHLPFSGDLPLSDPPGVTIAPYD